MGKDLSDFIAEGGSVVDLVASSQDANIVRAVEAITQLGEDLLAVDAGSRSEFIVKEMEKSSLVAAVGNGMRKDSAALRPYLMKLAMVDGAPAGLKLLSAAVAKYLEAGIRAVESDEDVSVDMILDGITDDAYRIPLGLSVPGGFVLTSGGIWKIVETKNGQTMVPVVQVPIVPTGILKDVDSGKELVVVSWYLGQSWSHVIAPREELTSKNKIEQWSGFGMPVSSKNSAQLAEYVSDFVVENYEILPRARLSSSMGWQSGNDSFLWGKTLIRDDTITRYLFDIDRDSPTLWDSDGIYFRPTDGGAAQLADALSQAGSFQKWKSAIRFLDSRPAAKAGIVFACCSPLLHIIEGSAPFTVDWGGATSKGKSTTLKYAASVWGRAREDDNRYYGSWSTTRINVERTLSILRNIPLIMDDTKKAARPEEVAKVVYDITTGMGRGRASPSGLQVSGSYRTIMLTNGEHRITSFTKDGGSFTRVLQFFGSPLGGDLTSDELAQLNESMLEIERNYGHLGPLFIQRLLANKESWPRLQAQYEKLYSKWAETAMKGGKQSPFAGRLAKYMAIFELTSQLLVAFFGVGGFDGRELIDFWDGWNEFSMDADHPFAALTYICNRAYLDRASMWSDVRSGGGRNGVPPPGGWRGVIPVSVSDDGIYIARQWLEIWLKQGDFDVANTIETWLQRGWLTRSSAGRAEHRVFVDGNPVMLLQISTSAIKLATGSE